MPYACHAERIAFIGRTSLCHEVYNNLRYLFSYMAVQISKNKNAMIEGRKEDIQLSMPSFLPFRCIEDIQDTI
ncbi:MAG: hypothetical protein SPJ90_02135 [Prevotella sp.]|nr:hypothetical protein [Prevotellaceae bacterium]MDY5843215.1 hypothetical protein [Prevotella sp.]